MRYALQVQYIGKNYAGSQIQFENGKEIDTPTIQGELEKAISTLISGDTANNNRHLKTVFSGRKIKCFLLRPAGVTYRKFVLWQKEFKCGRSV